MAIKRYFATKDTTITNAFMQNLRTRAIKSNMGESDILELFSLYGQAQLTSSEASRILIDFPISDIIQDIQTLTIPQTGSVQFILNLTNAKHGHTTPKNIDIDICPLEQPWTEGFGLDMENYSDFGPANWVSSSNTSSWSVAGGSYNTSSIVTTNLSDYESNIQVDITNIVEDWIADIIPKNGLLIKLSDLLEQATESYYTKKFFARGSQYFYFKPYIEARYDDSISDDRQSFYNSSSLAPASDNINRIYLYNRHRGRLVDFEGTGSLYCSIYAGDLGPTGLPLIILNTPSNDSFIEATRIKKGIYEAEIVLNTAAPYVYDVWHDGNGTYFYTGSAIAVKNSTGDDEDNFQIPDYVVNITNLKSTYSTKEKPRLNLFIRNKEWDPTIYTIAKSNAESFVIKDAFYKIYRIIDNLQIIPYSVDEQIAFSKLSRDGKGNYFDLDMSLFEPGYTYAIKFLFKEFDLQQEQREIFKFRVED